MSKYMVIYDRFCLTCGTPGHEKEQCATYKTRMCRFWKQGGCLREHCTFAHGSREIRKEGESRCVKVVPLHDNACTIMGCGEVGGHVFEDCPKTAYFGECFKSGDTTTPDQLMR